MSKPSFQGKRWMSVPLGTAGTLRKAKSRQFFVWSEGGIRFNEVFWKLAKKYLHLTLRWTRQNQQNHHGFIFFLRRIFISIFWWVSSSLGISGFLMTHQVCSSHHQMSSPVLVTALSQFTKQTQNIHTHTQLKSCKKIKKHATSLHHW